MKSFRGKVVLVVNTASRCGFTPQYEGLEALYREFKERGLVVLGFPCDQFAHQEPDDDAAIQAFCKRNFGVTFPLFSRINVNGPDVHPLFRYLKDALPGVLGKKIKWNFTKFLIAADGKPVRRFAPKTAPEKIKPQIEALLTASGSEEKGEEDG